MVHYKLEYFDVRGLGEMIRMILHYKGIRFEEKRFAVRSEEWYAYKNCKGKLGSEQKCV